MTGTKIKKAFKDWDISDFDFTNAESLAHSSVQTNRRPFIPFVKLPKGVERKPYPNYPTSNLAAVMVLGGVNMVDVYKVAIALPNGKVYHDVKVFGAELDEYAALIGMDLITRTDFLITRSAQRDALLAKNADGKTTFQFCTPAEGGVEL